MKMLQRKLELAAQQWNLRRNNGTCGAIMEFAAQNVKRSDLLSKYCGASNFIAAQFIVFQQKVYFSSIRFILTLSIWFLLV